MKDNFISREMAIRALWKALYKYEDKMERQFIESNELNVNDWIEYRTFVQNMNDSDRQAILELPSVQPEKIRGRWQEITESDCSGYNPVLAGYDDPVVGYVCSVCHEGYEKEIMGSVIWNYCPNCGARMDGNDNG